MNVSVYLGFVGVIKFTGCSENPQFAIQGTPSKLQGVNVVST